MNTTENTASAKHTPGPWRFVDGLIETESEQAIACMLSEHGPYANAAANGRLIEAAPELLAACEAMVAYYAKYPDKYWLPGALMARAAISKAKVKGGAL